MNKTLLPALAQEVAIMITDAEKLHMDIICRKLDWNRRKMNSSLSRHRDQ